MIEERVASSRDQLLDLVRAALIWHRNSEITITANAGRYRIHLDTRTDDGSET